MTQTFGLGTTGAIDEGDVAAIEAFLRRARRSDTARGVSARRRGEVRPSRRAQVSPRGAVERALVALGEKREAPRAAVDVRVAEPNEGDASIETFVAGWAESEDVASMIRGSARVTFANDAVTKLVALDRSALLAGASTVPGARWRVARGSCLALGDEPR